MAMQEDVVRSSARSSQKLWGILRRKERWGLSWRGRLLVALVVLLAVYVVILNVHPFLAVTDRVNTHILVIEGWMNQYGIRKGADESKTGSYERVFTTGGPEIGSGGYTNDYQTSAGVGAESLKKLGLPDELVQMVPSHVIGRDRTYNSAVALRDWFHEHNMSVHSMNVLTEDAHARRTRLLYQKAFAKDVMIGIISVPNPDYDTKRWWRYSDGVREVIGESIAYVYARFFFYPSESSHNEKAAGVSQADISR
jgi:DUF218 domain-containing protein